ncbi:tetratricopeptide repeat protein [Litchfieldia salsa]|uniref:Uncharacterized protein n=1 Tax=Litchfieldia salsa TaxID=930152 RepID=A0A1H0STD4_9BACI|nr:hypothetical protein [Litchfieldia salsa]SDP44829.1 hypothetical protein SAMN05216565_103101 [Litchfieldia salsa]
MIITITDDKRKLELNINGLYLFQGYQVLEAFTSQQDECYYLFFYKNEFLTGKRTNFIKRSSTLQQILTKGIYLSSPQPIIKTLLDINTIHSIPSINTTWKKINKSYKEVEAAHILTVFDNYLKMDKVISLLQKICLQFRRDGNLLQAYRMLNLLLTKYPTNQWAKSLITHLNYQKYTLKYQSHIKSLLNYDPLYAEIHLYLNLHSTQSFDLLQQHLYSESRTLECLTLYTHHITSSESKHFEDYFQQLLKILPIHYSSQESLSYLYRIYEETKSKKNKAIIQNEIVSRLLDEKRYEDAYFLLIKSDTALSTEQINLMIKILEVLDVSYSHSFDTFQARILTNANKIQLEQIFKFLVPKLFKSHDITYIYHWMKPLLHIPNTYTNKIKTLYDMKEEPDQQHFMGELYYEINQLPQAIECYLWDLELNPTNPRPIKWLSKLYREIGMIEESTSYQYLYKQIQKSS